MATVFISFLFLKSKSNSSCSKSRGQKEISGEWAAHARWLLFAIRIGGESPEGLATCASLRISRAGKELASAGEGVVAFSVPGGRGS